MLNFVLTPPQSSLLYEGNYDLILVSLSVIVAIFASYAALLVSQHVSIEATSKKRLWIAGGSLCLGVGMWAMHFVGMLAFTLPCSTRYDATLTLLSTIPGILASALALKIISRREISPNQLATGGLLIGAGIGTMHYSGMAAMRLNGLIRYDIKLFALSLIVAVVLATLALLIRSRLQSQQWRRWSLPASAAVLGLAVSGMHYTAMASAYFIRDGDSSLIEGIAPAFLAAIVLAATGLIIVITIIATHFDKTSLLSRSYRMTGLLVICWLGISWLSSDYYYSRLTDSLYQQESQTAAKKAEQVADNIGNNIKLLKGISQVFSKQPDTIAALHNRSIRPEDQYKQRLEKQFIKLNKNLNLAAGNLGADVIFLLDSVGNCIASSNAGKPDSFVGTNYADRNYFRQAQKEGYGQQYAVGRISKIPGLYYSTAVTDAGHFSGAVIVKRNIDQFSHWASQENAFISDSNGVIVLASDKSLKHHYLPGASVASLPVENILQQYSTEKLLEIEPLSVAPWRHLSNVLMIQGKPAVFASISLTGDGLTIHVPRSLEEITRLDTEKIWLFLLISATGSMLIIAASAIVLYLRESTRSAADLRIAASAFEAQEGMMITDTHGIILRVNKAFTAITGYSAEESIGMTPKLLNSGRQDAIYYQKMWERITDSGSWEGEIWNRKKSGEIYPEYLTISSVKDKDSKVTHYVGTFHDITATKKAADEINHLAFYDHLTGLPNRRLLTDRLKQALISRNSRPGALLFIDLDNFKALNDTLGHDIGDMLLQQVSQRLISCVREGDTVARLGGDEFVVMLEELSARTAEAATQTESVADEILSRLNRPYQLGAHECHSTPSIGATLFNDNPCSIDELFKQADIAMYQAKKAGRNTLRFFDPVMQQNINARAALETELHSAIENGQLHLYYQVQVDSSNQPLGAEALIRWAHPERGMVSPAQFIPLAEDTGLILPIGLWVLNSACEQLKKWESEPRTNELVLAVNVSARQFRQSDFVTQVAKTVARHDINASRLKLELTESLLLENVESIIETMNALKKIGIQFSLDDFGTGYSSLQYLKRLPLNQLKIDQSFVRDIASDTSDKLIVRTIIAMAHSLNLDVIAEGVETEQQQQLLLDQGCTHFQGYLFGKPEPEASFNQKLTQFCTFHTSSPL